jgi:hypothetical protein
MREAVLEQLHKPPLNPLTIFARINVNQNLLRVNRNGAKADLPQNLSKGRFIWFPEYIRNDSFGTADRMPVLSLKGGNDNVCFFGKKVFVDVARNERNIGGKDKASLSPHVGQARLHRCEHPLLMGDVLNALDVVDTLHQRAKAVELVATDDDDPSAHADHPFDASFDHGLTAEGECRLECAGPEG